MINVKIIEESYNEILEIKVNKALREIDPEMIELIDIKYSYFETDVRIICVAMIIYKFF